jgi:hypothetical protein
MECIHLEPRSTDAPSAGKYLGVIDEDECVECRCCTRANVCESDALFQPPLKWPRTIRAAFSDPTTTFEETGVPGRGTEEMKTNEVTGRYKHGIVGFAAEVGRPTLGARLRDLEKISVALATAGARFEPMNPVTITLMQNPESGKLKPDVLNEKVMSAIIEAEVPLKRFRDILRVFRRVGNSLESVFSLNVICLTEKGGFNPAIPIILEEGFHVRENGKTNLGLGRRMNQEKL